VALAELDEGTFTEGHELDRKTAKQSAEGDDWTPVVSGGSEEVVG
jgi:hypothetical protein